MSQLATSDRFIRYGVSSELALKASNANLTVSSARALSRTVLAEKFGLSEEEVAAVKIAVVRQPIKDEIVDSLLNRSNFTCNICKGIKSVGYVIHHIIPYEKSQNNSYHNLIVLCPACHDLAHRSGLTLGITEKQLRRAKSAWENQVLEENVRRAAQQIVVRDDAIDYVNIMRIEERCVRLFKHIPDTSVSPVLKRKGILGPDASFDQKYVQEHLSGGRYLFDYTNSGETEHYKQLLEKIAEVTEFADLGATARKGYAALKQLEGRYAYFIGGVYGNRPRLPITDTTPEVRLYYPTKRVYIEWILDPKFLMSMSSIGRVGGKSRYIIYSLIRTVYFNKAENRTYINASPLLIGSPTLYIDKTPVVALERQYELDIAEQEEENFIESDNEFPF